MKKNSFLVRAFSFLLMGMIVLCCCAAGESVSVRVEGAIFGGTAGNSVSLDIPFMPEWITADDADVYNPQLAKFAALLSADVYFREKDLAKGTPNRVLYEGEDPDEYEITALLKRFGFSVAEYAGSYGAADHGTDPDDSVTLLMGWRNVSDLYDMYVFVFRGSFSIQEWLSSFDPGAATDRYTALTGEHPEWTDALCFKGFDVARNRAVALIDAFMEAHGSPDRKDRILVTGHSRGGSIANLVGATLEKREDLTVRTYTFSAAGVTTDPAVKDSRTVFNLYDSNDFFADLFPFADENFIRYGRDLTLSIRDSEEILHAVEILKGKNDFDSLTAEQKSDYAALFRSLFPSRNSICETRVLNFIFDHPEDAEALIADYEIKIGSESGLGLVGLCSVKGIGDGGSVAADESGRYPVTLEYSGLALFAGYAKTLAYGSAAYEIFSALFSGDGQALALADFMIENLPAINSCHRLINTYALADFVSAD